MTWGDVGAFFAVVGVMVSCLVVAVIDVWWEKRKRDKKTTYYEPFVNGSGLKRGE